MGHQGEQDSLSREDMGQPNQPFPGESVMGEGWLSWGTRSSECCSWLSHRPVVNSASVSTTVKWGRSNGSRLLTSQGFCEKWLGPSQRITCKGCSLEYKDETNSCPLALPWLDLGNCG